jgi:translocation and assembly module TamB
VSEEQNAPVTTESTESPKPQRSNGARFGRGVVWTILGLVVLVIVLFLGFAYYSTTPDFQRRVGQQVVTVLEDSTGGKVDLGLIKFDIWHLAIEGDNLVIHGLEGPDEAPYLAADRILIRLKILSFLQRTTGGGVASHIGLSLLRVEQPRVHLIIDKNGKTNQPVPKHPSQSNKPVIDTLLDLRAQQVELVHGIALLNDRAIPFNLAAADLDAQVKYLSATDRYGATIDLRDLRTQMQKEPEAKSSLHLEAEMGRDMAQLTKFDFHTGETSELTATAAINHFANPEWQAKLVGSLELKQISILTAVDGLKAGTLDVDLGGHNCYVAPAVAQKHPKFWQRERSRKEAATTAPKTLPPDPDCQNGYLLVGSMKLHNAAYQDQYVRLHDINGGAQLHITPTQLLFTALTGYLPGGGSAAGDLKIDNWLGEVPQNAPTTSATVKGATTTANKTSTAITGREVVSNAPVVAPVVSARAYLTVKVDRIPLRTIMDVSAPVNYGDLGFDTSITGPVKVEWGGPATSIADTVQVDADLQLSPTGVRRRGALSDIPVNGQLLGHYDGKTEVVQINRLQADTPQSTLTASGILGVNLGDPLTDLNVDLSVRNLGEYDQLLRTLGLTGNGKKGVAAIPVALHGQAKFHGTARGAIAKLDVKGHLEATNLEVRLGALTPAPVSQPAQPANVLTAALNPKSVPAPAVAAPTQTDIHVDSLVADAEYTPSGLAVASSTITQGTAVLHVSGAFRPRTVIVKKTSTYVWDDGTAVDAKVQLANANFVDLLTIAGQQTKVPVTGTVNLDAHVAGTFRNLNGAGTISLVNGVAYGEPFESMNVDATVQGQDIEASHVTARLHGMTVSGNGGYDIKSEKLHAHIEGNDLQLSKFKTVQDANLNADGVLSLNADANGTINEPGLKANLRLAKVVVDGKPIGEAVVDAHSQGKVVYYNMKSTLVGAQVAADGQTELTGNFETKAKLTLSGLDVAKPLALFQPDGFKAQSNISGTVTVIGPAKTPTALTGQAAFNNFEVTSQGITLKAAEPLQVSLRNGVATLDQVHITGPETDLRAGGTAQVFGAVDPKTKQPYAKGGKLNINASGSINMAIAHTIDPDYITSGKLVFAVGVGGIIANPSMTGKVEFQKVNIAVDGIPNGLSDMNGTLVFNEDRLNVQSLTATTGGGQLKIGGFLTYRNGLFADLTATGNVVRVRLYGLSATANANLRLQGSPKSSLLSGNVLLTRFGVGPDVDFAAFAGAGGVQAPPDPSAASNNIRLDVHVTSSPQLDFQNSYAKLAGTVDLTVRGTIGDPTVLGRIQITDGSATFAGTKYQLQRGDVYFSNPVRIDPTIDIDATARVENYDVTVGLHGTTTNLKPTYRSEPPLSEADVFALLALGRTQEESQLYQEQQIQAGTDPTTSSLLGGALNATVSNRVSKLFGVGSVKIDPAFVGTLGNSSARITVQQQLSRQITLTYATNVNSSAEQLIQVQYQLSPNVSIVATRDETGVFSLLYKIRKRYH